MRDARLIKGAALLFLTNIVRRYDVAASLLARCEIPSKDYMPGHAEVMAVGFIAEKSKMRYSSLSNEPEITEN